MNADIVTLYLTNSNFMTMHYDAFWRTKSNKFAILVHLPYLVQDAKHRKWTKTANLFWHDAKQI